MPAGGIKEKLLGDALKVTLRAAGNTDDKVHSTKSLHRNSLQKEPTLLRNIYNSEVILLYLLPLWLYISVHFMPHGADLFG